jgi:hypothetical protein
MKKSSPYFVKIGIAVALASILSACGQHSRQASLASETNFNDDWQFVKADKVPDLESAINLTGWEKVQLPHTT